MKAGQILYTSCKRGIKGDSSGFQTYSHSPNIGNWEADNQLGILFAQFNGQTMPLNLPILPTESEAQSLFPKRYSYRRIDGKDALCGVALCTYIGRDYPENSQRSGNFLGHGIVFPESECDVNPGLLVGSSKFVSSIDPQIVRQDVRPEALPLIEISADETGKMEEIQDFLSSDYRSGIFSQMLACLLNATDKKTGRAKRLIIHDDPENIQMWISSLLVSFPTKLALGLNYSTYEYNPESSVARIVGAAADTEYDLSKRASGQDYYFDMIANVIDDETFDDVNDYCDFVCDSLQYSWENLHAFHKFLESFSYTTVDERVKDAHNLYLLVGDVLAFDDFGVSSAKPLLSFSDAFADTSFNVDLAKRVKMSLHDSGIEEATFDTFFDYLNALVEKRILSSDDLKQESVEICVEHFCSDNLECADFTRLFASFDSKIKDGLTLSFLSRLEEIDVRSWLSANQTWKLVEVLSLGASDSKRVQKLLDRDSYQRYILTAFLQRIATLSGKEPIDAIQHLYKAYQKNGPKTLTMLYLAVRLTSMQLRQDLSVSDWADAYRGIMASFSEVEVVDCLQLLCSNGIEDDVTHLVNETAKDSSRDFLTFAKHLSQQLPTFFTSHKHELFSVCLERVKHIADAYSLFAFALDSEMFSEPELEKVLLQTAEFVNVTRIPESHDYYVSAFCKLCKQQGLPVPQRIALARRSIYLSELCADASKTFSNKGKLLDYVRDLTRKTPLKTDSLESGEEQTYYAEIAEMIAILIFKTEVYELQDELFVMDDFVRLRFLGEVFGNICAISKKQRKYELLLYLIVHDHVVCRLPKRNIIALLNNNGISPDALRKTLEKGSMIELNRYYHSLDGRPKEGFPTFINDLIESVEPPRGNSIFSNVKDRFEGLFKSDRRDE